MIAKKKGGQKITKLRTTPETKISAAHIYTVDARLTAESERKRQIDVGIRANICVLILPMHISISR